MSCGLYKKIASAFAPAVELSETSVDFPGVIRCRFPEPRLGTPWVAEVRDDENTSKWPTSWRGKRGRTDSAVNSDAKAAGL